MPHAIPIFTLAVGLVLLGFVLGKVRKPQHITIIVKNGKVVNLPDVPHDYILSFLYVCDDPNHQYCKINPDAMHA